MATKSEYPMRAFKSPHEFRRWLTANGGKRDGIWIRFYKKASEIVSLTYQEALAEALCFGWIDGQVRKHDEISWIQKFTPRRARSGWSKRNTEIAEKLIRSRRMRAAGLREIEAAKTDGRWERAYDSPSKAEPPADLLARLAKNKKAKAFYDSLSRQNRYAIIYRLQTAKTPETRDRRLKTILEMLTERRAFHP